MSGVGCGLVAPPVGSRRGDRRECGSFLARPRTPQPAPLRTGESAATKVAVQAPVDGMDLVNIAQMPQKLLFNVSSNI